MGSHPSNRVRCLPGAMTGSTLQSSVTSPPKREVVGSNPTGGANLSVAQWQSTSTCGTRYLLDPAMALGAGSRLERNQVMRLNHAIRNAARTHEGAPAVAALSPERQLRRSVLSCLVWERQVSEAGEKIADRIVENAEQGTPGGLATIAIEARDTFNLRHAPL